MKLVVFPDIRDQWAMKLGEASPKVEVRRAGSEEEAEDLIADADALYGRVTPRLLRAARQLRWVQAPSIGLENYVFPELVEHPCVLTNVRGIFSDHIANHVFAFILCFARDMHHHIRNQGEAHWGRGGDEYPVIHLADQTLGIVGLGGIGAEVAKRAAAFGMKAVAMDPNPKGKAENVQKVYGMGDFRAFLGQSDFVVICAPQTPTTVGLFDGAAFAAMKRSAILINIGRGKIVKLDALTSALREGLIAGAGLDVFEVEPLPKEHPLWRMDNVILTPHMAGAGPYVMDRRIGVVVENIQRFAAKKPLLNVVDKKGWC
jgi:phosphoglycerate dehydrogenase-like enzyme